MDLVCDEVSYQDDNLLFERLIFEINQAGLSWITILKKAGNFRAVYCRYDIDKIAPFDKMDQLRLLSDASIIRNRLKVNVAIENARRIQALRNEYRSFKGWLDSHHSLTLGNWTKLFKLKFIFTGGEIVQEFLMSTGYFPGAHTPDCPIYEVDVAKSPAWHSG